MTDRAPWKVWSGFRRIGSASTRQAAMNVVDRPWMRGTFEVRHVRSGEAWTRAGGTWSKTAEPRKSPPRRRASGGVTGRATRKEPPAQRRLL